MPSSRFWTVEPATELTLKLRFAVSNLEASLDASSSSALLITRIESATFRLHKPFWLLRNSPEFADNGRGRERVQWESPYDRSTKESRSNLDMSRRASWTAKPFPKSGESASAKRKGTSIVAVVVVERWE